MDLQVKSLPVSEEASQIVIGGQVAPGMKRWVTFLSLDSMQGTGASSVRLYLASVNTSTPTKASLIATANRKMLLDLRATGVVRDTNLTPDGPPLMIPDRPDVNKPLFSIAGGAFLGAWASYTTANVGIQFFDE
jgi:hypothetical protein